MYRPERLEVRLVLRLTRCQCHQLALPHPQKSASAANQAVTFYEHEYEHEGNAIDVSPEEVSERGFGSELTTCD